MLIKNKIRDTLYGKENIMKIVVNAVRSNQPVSAAAGRQGAEVLL
jgi:hypothetical protein